MGRLLGTGLGDDGMPGGAGTSSVVAATDGKAGEESKTSKGLDVRLLEQWCLLASSNAVVNSGDLAVRMGVLADCGKVGGSWSGGL
jgi:hypothetical protein